MQATSVRLFYIDLNSALTMKWKYDTEFPSNHYEYKMLDTLYQTPTEQGKWSKDNQKTTLSFKI